MRSSRMKRASGRRGEEYKLYANKANKEILYWMTLLTLIIATLVISVVLVPLIIVLEPIPLYALLVMLGVMLGSVFALLIRDIEGLQAHHHIIALLFLPAISILTLLVIITIASDAADLLMIPLKTSPVVAAVVYAVALILPYLFSSKNKSNHKL